MADTDFLDPKLCEEFNKVIDESPIFTDAECYNCLLNLICAAKDRIDTCVRYLNKHDKYPDTEEEFITFIMFSCMLVEAVKKLVENVSKKESQLINEKKYFKKYCMARPINCNEDEVPTDDRFFEHIRSLIFAHPFETSRNKVFKQKFGTQVSPWVSVNKHTFLFYDFPEPIGVKIYSEKKDEDGNDTHFIMFSFRDLKNYIASRYKEIVIATEWVKNATTNAIDEWIKTKVNRNQDNLGVLREIKSISEQRYQSTYTIQEIIDYLECPISNEKNTSVVEQYKDYIRSKIGELCDAVDALDVESQDGIEMSMIRFSPENMHKMYHYQMEKIFSYLHEKSEDVEPGSNEEWGLIQADNFYNEFGHKWVYMEPYKMSYTEIHLLVTVACYMEEKKQKGVKSI